MPERACVSERPSNRTCAAGHARPCTPRRLRMTPALGPRASPRLRPGSVSSRPVPSRLVAGPFRLIRSSGRAGLSVLSSAPPSGLPSCRPGLGAAVLSSNSSLKTTLAPCVRTAHRTASPARPPTPRPVGFACIHTPPSLARRRPTDRFDRSDSPHDAARPSAAPHRRSPLSDLSPPLGWGKLVPPFTVQCPRGRRATCCALQCRDLAIDADAMMLFACAEGEEVAARLLPAALVDDDGNDAAPPPPLFFSRSEPKLKRNDTQRSPLPTTNHAYTALPNPSCPLGFHPPGHWIFLCPLLLPVSLPVCPELD